MYGDVRGVGCRGGSCVDWDVLETATATISFPTASERLALDRACPGTASVSRTFREQPVLPALCVLAQEPAIAEVVVALDELNAISPPQTKLVRAAGNELICGSRSALRSERTTLAAMVAVELRRTLEGWGDSRTTTSRSPGRQCSVWERSPEAMAMAMVAPRVEGGCGPAREEGSRTET